MLTDLSVGAGAGGPFAEAAGQPQAQAESTEPGCRSAACRCSQQNCTHHLQVCKALRPCEHAPAIHMTAFLQQGIIQDPELLAFIHTIFKDQQYLMAVKMMLYGVVQSIVGINQGQPL